MLSVMLNKYISFQEITTFLVKILFSIQKYLSVIHNPGFLMYTFLMFTIHCTFTNTILEYLNH